MAAVRGRADPLDQPVLRPGALERRHGRDHPSVGPGHRLKVMPPPTPPPAPEFEEAFARHRPDLLRHCYRMLGCFSDAEEAVQEVLLRAWRSRETYAADAPIVHWLMRIATNT